MTFLPYSVQGSTSSPVLLMLHGFMGRRHDWDRLQHKLSSSYCYITLDLPGHGQALFDDDAPYSFSETCTLILNTLDQLGVDQFSVLGYSLGGRVAMNLALMAPERVSQLLLVSASPGIDDDTEREERLKLDHERAEALRTQQLRTFLENWYQLPLFQTLREHPKFESMISDRCLYNSPKHLAKAIVGYSPGTMESLWPSLSQLTMPVYYITGEFDKAYVERGKKIKTLLPHANLNIFPGCGHAVHVERRFDTLTWIASCMA